MIVQWKDYLDDVRPFLPECPDVVIVGAIRDAAERFCEIAQCWIDVLDGIEVLAAERDVRLGDLVDSSAVIVHPTWVGNETLGQLEPRTPAELDRAIPDWRYASGVPRFFTLATRGDVMWLAPHTESALTLRADVVLKPAPDAKGAPEDLWRDYGHAIQAGAIAALAGIPNKPWTNREVRLEQAGAYRLAVAAAGVKQSRGNTNRRHRAAINHRM